MRAAVVGAIAGALVTAGVFLANPDAEAHREAIRAQTAADSPLAAAIGLGTL